MGAVFGPADAAWTRFGLAARPPGTALGGGNSDARVSCRGLLGMILDVRITDDDMYDAAPGTTQKLPSASMFVLTLLADVIRGPMEATELPISRVAKFIALSSDSSFIIASTGLVSIVPSKAVSFGAAPLAVADFIILSSS